jgi:hypothetical protein
MRNTPLSSRHQQRGAILVIALIFLIAITLYTVSSMRSSNLGLFMAQNEESRVSATQGAQALADAIVASPASTPVVGDSTITSMRAWKESVRLSARHPGQPAPASTNSAAPRFGS